MRYKPVSVSKSLSLRHQLKRIILIGVIACAIALLLQGCVSNVNPAPIPPINCIQDLNTPLDYAKCLAIYDEAYGSLMESRK